MQTVQITAPVRLGQTRLPDGRRLGWAEWGPESGMPVLLCPGAPLADGWGSAVTWWTNWASA
ncbi:MAG TPA: hypothetical protein VK464_27290 [Symbiobacteriaceae bacterium]|jgi:hypothetical protein|nr:hypothetical protein [Symbiobacteriaceae bacterium]